MQILNECEDIQDLEDPFSDDITDNRKNFGKSLANLAKNYGQNQPLVIGLDGQWGEGKTYFLKRWCKELENKKERVKTIYLDAFKSDYTDDSFFSIINELYAFLEKSTEYDENDENNEKRTSLKGKINDFSIRSMKVLKYYDMNLANGLVEHFTFGGLSVDKLKKGAQMFSEKEFEEKLSESFKGQYNNYKDFKDNFEIFKKSLADCAELNLQITGYPIIFIIDELDRCKPIYALDLLEKIKHFFSVKGIVFILSMNKNQLINSIGNIYGIHSGAELYLQKFLTVETTMPKNLHASKDFLQYYLKMCNHYLNRVNIRNDYRDFYTHLLNAYNVSFRDCQKIFTYYAIVANNKEENILSFLLAILKVKKPSLYLKFRNGTSNYPEIYQEISNNIGEERLLNIFDQYLCYVFSIKKEFDTKFEIISENHLKRIDYYLDSCNLLDLYHINQ